MEHNSILVLNKWEMWLGYLFIFIFGIFPDRTESNFCDSILTLEKIKYFLFYFLNILSNWFKKIHLISKKYSYYHPIFYYFINSNSNSKKERKTIIKVVNTTCVLFFTSSDVIHFLSFFGLDRPRLHKFLLGLNRMKTTDRSGRANKDKTFI